MNEGGTNENRQLRQGPVERFAFDLLQSMVHGNELPDSIATVLLVIEDFQLVIFALSPIFQIKNVPTILEAIVDPVYLFYNHAGAHSGHQDQPITNEFSAQHLWQIVFFGISIALILIALASSVGVGVAFQGGNFRGLSLISLKVLRIVTMLLGSILFIPVLQLLMMNLDCDYNTGRITDEPHMLCLSGPNLPIYIISVVCLVVLIPLILMTASIFFSYDPAAHSLHARNPIAYFDTVYTAARVSLVVLFSLVRNRIVLIVALLLWIIYLLYLHSVSQPFYHEVFNQLRCGLMFGAFLGTIVAAVACGVETPEDDKSFITAFGVLYVVGLVSGYFGAPLIKSQICKRVYRQMKLVKEQKRSQRENPVDGWGRMSDHREGRSEREGEANDATAPNNFLRRALSSGHLVVEMAESIVHTWTVQPPVRVFYRPSDVELACRFINHNRSQAGQRLVQEIFEQGLEQFPDNATLCLIFSRYIAAFFERIPEEDLEDEIDDHKSASGFSRGKGVDFEQATQESRSVDWATLYLNKAKGLKPSLITRYALLEPSSQTTI
ncbi:hypothetical protein HK102_002719 [Quaeritorhiza haematococci]|nr:hypothetical protein HK102_002719 [Quaeritorhiza haematococci]